MLQNQHTKGLKPCDSAITHYFPTMTSKRDKSVLCQISVLPVSWLLYQFLEHHWLFPHIYLMYYTLPSLLQVGVTALEDMFVMLFASDNMVSEYLWSDAEDIVVSSYFSCSWDFKSEYSISTECPRWKRWKLYSSKWSAIAQYWTKVCWAQQTMPTHVN